MIQLYIFWANIQRTLNSPCQRDTYTSMFIAAVFTVTRKWSQTICPSRTEWIQKNMVHIHSGILFNHKEKIKFTGRMVLENIIAS